MSGNFTATRTITYASGAIIYAANHNTNETTIYTAHNNAFNASTGHQHTGATGDAPKLTSTGMDLTATYAWTGAHTFTDVSATALAVKSAGFANNLGCTLSSGRFQITAADGTALSSTNIARVATPSTTAGLVVTLSATDTGHWFDDDSATSSSIVGEQFGVTTGVAWGDSRPFFIYAVNGDNTNAGLLFAISPDPTCSVSPSSANNVGYRGVPATTPADTNFFFLTATNVTATHNNKPCVLVGSITMTMSALDDWTVQTLGTRTGIGRYCNVNGEFEFSTAQMGAATGKFFKDNGGTAPSFSSSHRKYRLGMDGMVDYMFAFQSGTNGAGAVSAQLAVPYKAINPSPEGQYTGVGYVSCSGGYSNHVILTVAENTTTIFFREIANVVLQYTGDFGGVDNNVFGTIRYPAFGVTS